MKKRGRKDSKDRGDQRDNKLRKKDQRRDNRNGGILSITGTVLIAAVIVLCSMLVLPGIFGFHMYHVLSGSMEPAIPVGSLLYVKDVPPENVDGEDIIAFYSSLEDSGIITHRVVENHVVSGTFQTKGDANDGEDPTPVPYANYIGEVVRTIPYMGKLLTVMTSFYGKIAAACVVALGALLNFIGKR